MANRLNAVLAINASGFYAKTNKPMGTVVRNESLLALTLPIQGKFNLYNQMAI